MKFLRLCAFVIAAVATPGAVLGVLDGLPAAEQMVPLALGSLALGCVLHFLIRRSSADVALTTPAMPQPVAQPIPAPPPTEEPAKPEKPSEPPTYGSMGYWLRVVWFLPHAIAHYGLKGVRGFLMTTVAATLGWAYAINTDDTLYNLSGNSPEVTLETLPYLVLPAAIVAIVPWFCIRWFFWPISEPKWPDRPVPAPKAETPVNPTPASPQAPMAAPAPPPLQRPAETMVSAGRPISRAPSTQAPANPDLQRWTDRA